MEHGEKICFRTFPFGRWKRKWEVVEFRKDPIPGTGKTVYKCGFRNPRTTQERRWNGKSNHIRAKRRMQNIPDAWEDIRRTDIDHRCWKTQSKKRKQWM